MHNARHVQRRRGPLRLCSVGGPDCMTQALPFVREAVGPRAARRRVCGIHTQPAFPSSCDCVWECHQLALDARQECVVEPSNGQSMEAAQRLTKQRMG